MNTRKILFFIIVTAFLSTYLTLYQYDSGKCIERNCTNGGGTKTYVNEKVENEIGKNNECVQRIIKEFIGTGFAVSKEGLIVTTYHLVQEASLIKVHLHDGSLAHAKIQAKDCIRDIAILKLNITTPNYLAVAPVNSAKTGDRVFTIGFPMSSILNQEAKYTEGVISSLSDIERIPFFLQITVPIQPGNSGGALVNEDGLVVGIISSTDAMSTFLNNAGTLPQNFNWAVKADYLRLLTDLPKPTLIKYTREEIIAKTKKATFLIEAMN